MRYRHAHFIGIGGAGMSATAKLLKDRGVYITGSDEHVYPPISDILEHEQFDWHTSYNAAHIPSSADVIVIGKNAKLTPETNEEVRAAYESGIPIRSFPEILAELSESHENTIVAGSYGKSTCTALAAHCLQHAGHDPSFFIGAVPRTPTEHAHHGTDKLFILEGDEYPASNIDSRSKFLLLHASNVLLTPLAHDHRNVFPTPESYLAPFRELLHQTPGVIVATEEGELSLPFLTTIDRPVVTYGYETGIYHARDVVWGEQTSFLIYREDTEIVRVTTELLGAHNIQNIVGVAALLFSLDLTSPGQFQDAIASFRGLRRRLDRISDGSSVLAYEGFGSSYEKARNAVAAIRLHFPHKRLVVIFEPNTIDWRSRATLPQYADVFEGADRIFLFQPPDDGKHTELDTSAIAAYVRDHGYSVSILNNIDAALSNLPNDLQPNDVVLLLSSGPLGGLPQTLPRLLAQHFPTQA